MSEPEVDGAVPVTVLPFLAAPFDDAAVARSVHSILILNPWSEHHVDLQHVQGEPPP
jgi:hypothetical protein